MTNDDTESNRTMGGIGQLRIEKQGDSEMPGYSEEIAVRILEYLVEIFPAEGDLEEMKLRLVPSSEQHDFLTAMNALFKLDLIAGKTLMTNRSIVGAMSVNISSKGREYLKGRNRPIAASDNSATVHGDQYISYGPVGAIGQNAVGTVNTFQQCWQQLKPQVDLTALAGELKRLRIRVS